MATEKKADALDVARWMYEQIQTSNRRLYQETAVWKIKREFGSEFVYQNANGNLAIGKDVLKHFRKLTEGKLVWERGERAWRPIRDNEKVVGRQVE